MENNDVFWKKPVNVPHLIAIAVSFDTAGNVEDIFFSKGLTENQRQQLRIDAALFAKLKVLDLKIFDHRNEVILFPLLDYHAKEMTIETGFMDDYRGLWPQLNDAATRKKLVLLDPYYN